MIIKRIRAKVRAVLIGLGIHVHERSDMVRLGGRYGGWWIPRDLISSGSTCYLAGVGEDVSFDLALIDQIGCSVWAFDPTPRAIAYSSTINEPKFHFIAEGLWSANATIQFFEPRNPDHVSHSAINSQRTEGYFLAPCRSVRSFMDDLDHSDLTLLKLDIEGAEVEVLNDLLLNGPLPTVLCVEFDAPEMIWRTLGRVRRLQRAGYVAAKVEGLNAVFIRVTPDTAQR